MIEYKFEKLTNENVPIKIKCEIFIKKITYKKKPLKNN
jgi:hypothetical protein